MPATRRLLREEITYSVAKTEVNILHRLGYYECQSQFFTEISHNHAWIKSIVVWHLNLQSADACHVADMRDWRHGSFNVLIQVTIRDWKNRRQPGQRVFLRLPLPYRVGDDFNTGNGDEKIRCEAGSYAWLQENCPDVRIPRLYGFALSTGQAFTHLEHIPAISRYIQYVHCWFLKLFGRPIPSSYVRNESGVDSGDAGLNSGYVLIEYIEETTGKMLSSSWLEGRKNLKLRNTFFRDLSRILLSVTRTRLPRIGSFIIDNSGFLQLTNRPLTTEMVELENEQIPTYIPRGCTYSTVNSYAMDLLGMHNSRLRNQPNAINNLGDCLYQASALTAMQAVIPSFLRREHSRGPFVFSLTDLHASNIFVDNNWHITALVDLEWACSRPIEMCQAPYWLTNQAVDELAGDSEEYDQIHSEFLDILASEEEHFSFPAEKDPQTMPLSAVMKEAWEIGTFWFTLALASLTGLFAIFYKQIQPRFLKYSPEHEGFQNIMPWYWSQDFVRVAANKRADKEKHDTQLRQAFQDIESEN